MPKHKALILDFDGVIVDSEDYWPGVEDVRLAQLLPSWNHGDYKAIVGKSMIDVYAYLQSTYDLQMTLEEFMVFSDSLANDVYDQCQLVDGILDLIQRAKDAHMPVAIASSSRHRWIDQALKRFDALDLFDVIISGWDLPEGRGKPMPDIYFKAAKAIGHAPEQCITIEDSEHGIQSAVDAGTYCYGFRAKHNADFNLSKAHKEIQGFAEVTL